MIRNLKPTLTLDVQVSTPSFSSVSTQRPRLKSPLGMGRRLYLSLFVVLDSYLYGTTTRTCQEILEEGFGPRPLIKDIRIRIVFQLLLILPGVWTSVGTRSLGVVVPGTGTLPVVLLESLSVWVRRNLTQGLTCDDIESILSSWTCGHFSLLFDMVDGGGLSTELDFYRGLTLSWSRFPRQS